MQPTSDAELCVDALAVGAIAVGVCLASGHLAFMSVLVFGTVLARFAGLGRVRGHGGLAAEARFFTLCTLLGAFNDWSSVARHGIYHYTVPAAVPALGGIPVWMMLYWGLILRFIVRLACWQGNDAGAIPRDRVRTLSGWRSSATRKVGLQIAILLATRQSIYRTFEDPLWSWLPFAIGALVYVVAFGLDAQERKLAFFIALVGPTLEVLMIQVGGLHEYALGWIGGMPLWIAIWWVLAALIWKDLGRRLERVLADQAYIPSSTSR